MQKHLAIGQGVKIQDQENRGDGGFNFDKKIDTGYPYLETDRCATISTAGKLHNVLCNCP